MAGEVMPGLFEVSIRHKDGRDIPLELTSAVTTFNNSKANVAYIRDISERKRIEEQLRKSEERFRSTMDEMEEPCLILAFDYRVVYANRACAEYARMEPEEMQGKPIEEIFSETDHTAWFETMRNCMRERLSDSTQYAYTHPKRGKVWLEQHIQPIPEGLFLISQDITTCHLSQNTLKRSREQLRRLSMHLETAREKERQTVAAEIHDELGQLLTAIKMDAVMLGNKLPPDQAALIARTNSMRELVDITIATVKRISAELRPHLLDNLGLAAAIEWQVKQVEDSSGISCRFVSKPPDMVLENSISAGLFRVCQEALTNAVRHSGANLISINLSRYAHTVRLVVKDDGRGIAGDEMEDQKAFGIIGMRERIHSLGGVLRIKGESGKGTTISVSIPLVRKGGG
jgi:PAS domain S-box-containing protein